MTELLVFAWGAEATETNRQQTRLLEEGTDGLIQESGS